MTARLVALLGAGVVLAGCAPIVAVRSSNEGLDRALAAPGADRGLTRFVLDDFGNLGGLGRSTTPWKLVTTAVVMANPPRHVLPAQRLERRAILSGVGQSQIGRRLFRTDMDLTAEAALRAIADAGLTPDDIDGIASYPGFMSAAPAGFSGPSIVDVQDALGLSVSWHQAGPEGPAQIAPSS